MENLIFDDSAISSDLNKIGGIELAATETKLSDSETKVVELLKKASKAMDDIFIKQICPDTLEVINHLEKEKTAANLKRLKYLRFAKSPFNPLNGLKPFVTWKGMCKDIALYPKGLTKEELEDAIEKGQLKREEAFSYYTALVRDGESIKAKKYSEMYYDDLRKVADILNEASTASENASLREYLKESANAFLSNDYHKQQLLWLKLDGNIEPTIGPYETYEDREFGYKAFFESYISVRNQRETEKLSMYSKYLNEIDLSLPIGKEIKFERKDQSNSPMVVVDEVFFGGEANAGFVTSAFNLPNDESIRSKYGSKKVLMKNIIDLKFEKLSKRIGERLLDKSQLPMLDRGLAFDFVLFHELSHGLGASSAIKDGSKVMVPVALGDLFSHIEEARADITGLYVASYLFKKGVMRNGSMGNFYVSYFVTNILRGMRMGLKEAHAMGQAIEYNYMKELGGISYDPESESFSVNLEKISDSALRLCTELNEIEATADYARAKRLTDKYCRIPAEVAKAYESISDIPIEIFPFSSEE